MSDTLHREEFLAGYVAEVQEHLAAARRAALSADEAIRRSHSAPRPVRELFRALHTIKGLSGMIGVEPIVDVAHEMETVLRAADRAGGRLRPQAFEVLLKGIDLIEDRVQRVARGESPAAAPRQLIEALAALDAPAPDARLRTTDLPPDVAAKLGPAEIEQLFTGLTSGRRAVRIDFVPSAERAARGVDITAVRERVERLAEIVKVLPRRGDGAPAGLVFVLVVLTSATAEELAAAAETTIDAVRDVQVSTFEEPDASLSEDTDEPARAAQAYVRVDVVRLDDALDRVSALLLSRARLERAVRSLALAGTDVRVLEPLLQDHARELRLLRSSVMRARMVRLSDVLERAPLLVRGLAQSSRKKVRLVMEVGEVEVDKAVGERLFPAVVHLLRNAVDHAIEPPEERRAARKPEEATLTIGAARRGEGQLEIVVSDDGRGIDVAAVARKAGAPAPTTSSELLDLIARPGLSTIGSPTRTSGRGIGMDVVRRIVVTELGGSLDVRTAAGAGTTFTARVPVSITIVDGLTFECAGETYVVPTVTVEELVEVEAEDLIASPAPSATRAQVRILRWRGEAVPYFDLREVLALRHPGRARRAIVLRPDGSTIAFGVDRMIGRQEVVIRSVADPLVPRHGIAGATDLGDGRPTLVLDLAALARRLPSRPQETAACST